MNQSCDLITNFIGIVYIHIRQLIADRLLCNAIIANWPTLKHKLVHSLNNETRSMNCRFDNANPFFKANWRGIGIREKKMTYLTSPITMHQLFFFYTVDDYNKNDCVFRKGNISLCISHYQLQFSGGTCVLMP